MIDNVRNIMDRIQDIRNGGKMLNNKKPSFVKEFENLYRDAVMTHRREQTQQNKQVNPDNRTDNTVKILEKSLENVTIPDTTDQVPLQMSGGLSNVVKDAYTDSQKAVQNISSLTDYAAVGPVDSSLKAQIEDAVTKASFKYNVSRDVIRAVIKAESNFDPKAVSHAGAQGLMQLMPATARELGVKNSFDIYENIDGGTHYIKKMLDRFDGNLEKALAAYNAGPHRVESAGGIPDIRETKNYVGYIKRLLFKG